MRTSIRLATEADLPAITEMYNHYVETSVCTYRFTVENAVYVRTGLHRRGIGRLILGDLVERSRAIGHKTIIAVIDAEQAGSVTLHRQFGFGVCGEMKRVGFKFGRWLDVVLMPLLLS